MRKVEEQTRANFAHLLSARFSSEAPAEKVRSYKVKSSVVLLPVLDWTFQFLN